MTRIAVLSDTHGDLRSVDVLAERIKNFDYLIHAGDFDRDVKGFQCYFPKDRIVAVSGNCDISHNYTAILEVEGVKIFVTHGNRYGVELNTMRLSYAALEAGAQIAVYGHTHVPDVDIVNNVHILNPGSISRPRGGSPCTFGVIIIDEGHIDVHTEVL